MSRRIDRAEAAFRARVAENATRLREVRGLTVEDVAKRSGLHTRHLQKFEAGQLNATVSTIAKLSWGLDVSPEEILSAPPPESPPRRRARPVGRPRKVARDTTR